MLNSQYFDFEVKKIFRKCPQSPRKCANLCASDVRVVKTCRNEVSNGLRIKWMVENCSTGGKVAIGSVTKGWKRSTVREREKRKKVKEKKRARERGKIRGRRAAWNKKEEGRAWKFPWKLFSTGPWKLHLVSRLTMKNKIVYTEAP